jgi:acetylornithine aminotransferase
MKPLAAQSLADDPRVMQAKRLMLEALEARQADITSVRAADPERKIAYDALIRSFSQDRAGELFYPYLASGIGRGPLVELADGSVKYDMISGIGVHYWGHSSRVLVEAALDGAISDTIMQGNLQQGVSAAQLTRSLLELAGGGASRLRHCFLSSSGAMANENALKIVFQRRAPAQRVLAFERCFAGRTLALAQITDKAAYRQGLPTTLAVDYVPFFDAAHPEQSTAETLAVLRGHLDRYPKQHAAMWIELVQGEGGFYPGERPFFVAIMDELKARQIAIVVDEIQTFGRTSRPFAFQHFGLEEYVDVVTVGKLLNVCATLFGADYKPQPGLLSQTFTAASSVIACGQAALRQLGRADLFGADGRNLAVHRDFVQRFDAIAQRHPGWISGPYGLGAMIAFTPFDGSPAKAKALLHELFDAGVIAFYAGADPTRVRFLPPVPALAPADIDAVCRLLEGAMAKAASVPRA